MVLVNENRYCRLKTLEREVLLGFWKVHILHHAGEQPIYGQWVIEELRRHGYHLSPGTLYPLLNRLAGRGWLRAEAQGRTGPKDRRHYRLTAEGATVLRFLRAQVRELYEEVVLEHRAPSPGPADVSRKADLGRRKPRHTLQSVPSSRRPSRKTGPGQQKSRVQGTPPPRPRRPAP
jgi:PadR family transcriptional regulator, regulatory protein PadR